ncbi:uncharacterized protein EI90DRAFT_1488879 [Cantharellus anzutake]|uniref:uncharacterized protein n=1 Tax=Cantharellus anzutake TaxID=1750568 RepID=UPI0019033893|nr:uncharacterized protein EI90DRAFT_1488879 [Cantharellus anzutake]KAF8328901.1 hypothetical protein EI90DRAFT_1488879 [Cantharellus anzutake]
MSASTSKIPKKRRDLLESGLACLVCRYRKIKCDGIRPTCGRCLRHRKLCGYAEETPRARVKRLEETIQSLESEIAALRSNSSLPIHSAGGTESHLSSRISWLATLPLLERMQQLHTPKGLHVPETIPIFPVSTLSSNIPFASAEEQSFSHPGEAYPRVITRVAVESALVNWDIQTEMPCRLQDYLLRIFLAHRFQFHSGPLVARLLEGVPSSPTYGRTLHPSLVNSVCLLACHISGGSMSSHEPFFVARTHSELEASLAFADRLMDLLLASTLLGVYFTRTRRYPEAYTTLSGAIRFTIACGLQPLTVAQRQSGSAALLPPRNDLEMIEQRHAWFALNVADRILTRESGLPSSLPEGAFAEIHSSACDINFQAFPVNTLQASDSDWFHHWASPSVLLNPGVFDVSRGIDHVCLRARMELLFEGIRLFRAHNREDAETNPVRRSSIPFWQTFNFLEASLFEYQKTVLSLNRNFGLVNGEYSELGFGCSIPQSGDPNGGAVFAGRPNPALFSAKVMMYSAMISLQNVLLESSYVSDISGEGMIPEARRKAVQAANGMAVLLKLVIFPSASVTDQSRTEAVYSPMSTIYRDVSLLVGILQSLSFLLSLRRVFQPHVWDASIVMAREIRTSHISPANEAEIDRLIGNLDIFQTLVTVLRDLGGSNPMDNEVQRLIGDCVRAFLDFSPPVSTGVGQYSDKIPAHMMCRDSGPYSFN